MILWSMFLLIAENYASFNNEIDANSQRKISVTKSSIGGPYAPGDLIFEEEFNTLNLSLWHHEINMNGGGNNEFQIYDKDAINSYVRDGVLFIRPSLTLDKFGGNYEYLYNGFLQLEGCTDGGGPDGDGCRRQANYPYILPPVISARLRTAGSFSFKYGRVEARAKMPGGDWTWPAIWLLPEEWKYGGWPTSGEIDIVESRGNRKLFVNGGNIGSEQVGSTLHFGPYFPHNGWWATHANRNSPVDQGYDRDFHLYQLEWTPTYLKFSVDNVELRTITPPAGGFFELGQFPGDIPNPWVGADNFQMAPFDQSFHFILNVATGGNFFPDDATGEYPRPWPPGSQTAFLDFFNGRNNWQPTWQDERHAMQVDYIRVWAI